MKTGFAWVDGDITTIDDAVVRVDDPGLLVGHGVFETMRVELRGDPLPNLINRHLRRLRRSAEIVRLKVPYNDDDLTDACRAVIAAERRANPEAGPGFVRVRLTVTAGGTAAATAILTPEWPEVTTLAPIDAPINERSPLRGAKTLSHLEETWCRQEAERLGVGEVLRTNTLGHVSEGSSSNVFLVRGGEILTPSPATGCLPGITRELVCELFTAHERGDLSPDDLVAAEEIFITSSTRGVHPVESFGGRRLAAPGPRTSAVRGAVHRVLRGS